MKAIALMLMIVACDSGRSVPGLPPTTDLGHAKLRLWEAMQRVEFYEGRLAAAKAEEQAAEKQAAALSPYGVLK